VPEPSSAEDFLSAENRPAAIRLFGSETALIRYAQAMGGADAHEFFAGPGHASASSAMQDNPSGSTAADPRPGLATILRSEFLHAAKAVLPLTALLGVVLLVLVRERPAHLDELLLGVTLALIGMTMLTTGIRIGLSPLGNDVGTRLPQIYQNMEIDSGQIVIKHFDPALLRVAASPSGDNITVFDIYDGGRVQTVTYRPEWHDKKQAVYTHRIMKSPLTHPQLSRIGVVLILLFAFGMGYGTTIAEPALRAMGRAVEDISVGAIKGFLVVRAVSIGVGLGLIFGVLRILYNIPTVWMILPPYILLLPLTLFSDEDFAGIAWDSGGVTTGVVTVPLVLAMGLGLGEQLNIADGFGVLAMASVYPILAVLLFGMGLQLKQRGSLRAEERGMQE
jgi:hypothetical protein